MSAAKRISASKIISDSQRQTPNQKGSLAGLHALFSPKDQKQRVFTDYRATPNIRQDAPACRVYGSAIVKKVTGNLHITTLGHGYYSFEHTDHNGEHPWVERELTDLVMNLSHVIHELSFGPFFPAIAQPLDVSMETTERREYIQPALILILFSIHRFPILPPHCSYDLY
jgi:hypothetical protein